MRKFIGILSLVALASMPAFAINTNTSGVIATVQSEVEGIAIAIAVAMGAVVAVGLGIWAVHFAARKIKGSVGSAS